MKSVYTAHVITHGHMDIEWYMPLRSFRFWIQEALDRLLDTPESGIVPYVLDGQIYPLLSYLEMNPCRSEAVLKATAAKKLCIGPFYTQFDEWLPSGEGMVRNCLYGIKVSEQFGSPMRVGYLPDNFGHPGQLPQILRGFGIDSLLFMRGMPYIAEDFPDEFRLIGLDGSELIGVHFRDAYARLYGKTLEEHLPQFRPPMQHMPYYDGYISYEHLMELTTVEDPSEYATQMIVYAQKAKAYFPSGHIPIMIGCDHSPPHIGLYKAIDAANRQQEEICFIGDTPEAYISALREGTNIPKVYGELLGSRFQYLLLGALSTRSWIKRMHFAAEALLERYAEPLDTFAFMIGGRDHRLLLDEVWKLLFLNQAHDGIHGSSIGEVHTEMEGRYNSVRQICAGICHRALEQLGSLIEGANNKSLLFYVPVSTPCPQYAELWLPAGKEARLRFISADGRRLAVQILRRPPPERNELGQLRNEPYPFAESERALVEVSGSGFCTAFFADSAGNTPPECSEENPLQWGSDFIENEYLRITAAYGLINILDKETGMVYFGQNLILEEEETGDYWDTSPAWIPGEEVYSSRGRFTAMVREHGPVRAILAVETIMNVPSSFQDGRRSFERTDITLSFQVALYRKIKRVDVTLTINNTAKDHRMSLLVKPFIKTSEIICRTAFGTIRRSLEPIRQPGEKLIQPHTRLFPFREYAALEDHACGFGIAVKGLYDYTSVVDDITGDVGLKLTLLRGVGNMTRLNTKMRQGMAAMYPETPDAQCLGVQTFEYSFLPYRVGGVQTAEILADSFLYPPMAHQIKTRRKPGILPRLWYWKDENIRFSCFKRSWDGNHYILRLYESRGIKTALNLSLPGFAAASRCMLDETQAVPIPMTGGSLTLNCKPYEIITLLLEVSR
jgi:mannosylglycerate hydrolase